MPGWGTAYGEVDEAIGSSSSRRAVTASGSATGTLCVTIRQRHALRDHPPAARFA
jgi:hypothetical protein